MVQPSRNPSAREYKSLDLMGPVVEFLNAPLSLAVKVCKGHNFISFTHDRYMLVHY
jgi:hypothetical protein